MTFVAWLLAFDVRLTTGKLKKCIRNDKKVLGKSGGGSRSQPIRAHKKALFLHVGKSGGGTVEAFIHQNELRWMFDVWHPFGYLDASSTRHKHILVCIRDPVARAVSALHWTPDVTSLQRCIATHSLNGTAEVSCCKPHDNDNTNLTKFMDPRQGAISTLTCSRRASAADYFRNDASLIGEALGESDSGQRFRAEQVISSHSFSKTPLLSWTGGAETLRALSAQGARFYVVVLETMDGPASEPKTEESIAEEFFEQISFQIQRILADLDSNVSTWKTNQRSQLSFHNYRRGRKAAKQMSDGISRPSNKLLMEHRHATHSNQSFLSPAAKSGFAERYACDYRAIELLSKLGCGGLEACNSAIQRILTTPHALHALASTRHP